MFEKPTKSLNELFAEERARFIPEVGEQLEQKKEVEIAIEGGASLAVDYRIIHIAEKEQEDADPVVVLTGFGSGWEGISELGFSLAYGGRRVVLLSLPGYGNSDNPPKDLYENATDFSPEADFLDKALEKIKEENGLQGKKLHVVGHSMGAVISATYASKRNENISSLVLLNPGGVVDENVIGLATRFGISGAQGNMDYAKKMKRGGETDYQNELKQYAPKAESPFGFSRLAQRKSEAKRLAHAHMENVLGNVNCPITYISGAEDTVYPPGDSREGQLARIIELANGKVEHSIMAGGFHNMTITQDEIAAANIAHYLDKAELDRKAQSELV